MKVEGADKVQAMFSRLGKEVTTEVNKALQKNGQELVDTAKILIPVVSGESKAAIKGRVLEDGSYLCDFGPKSKVIEAMGGMRAFVNPALKARRKTHEGRNKRAVSNAVKKAQGDG